MSDRHSTEWTLTELLAHLDEEHGWDELAHMWDGVPFEEPDPWDGVPFEEPPARGYEEPCGCERSKVDGRVLYFCPDHETTTAEEEV